MILVNNPGNWSHIYAPLDHASWHGCTPTDLVFPFFLFAVGNALAFVMPKLDAAGERTFWIKVVKRSFLIFGIGVLLNWFPFIDWYHDHLVFKNPGQYPGKETGLRIFGVLQRIAVSYFFAAVIIHFFKVWGAFVAGAFILLAYWFLCVAAHPSDPYSIHGWFGTAVDKMILGEKHLYHGEGIAFDPEGLMSSFAAIVQVILGYIAGNYILQKGKTPEMLNGIFVAGCVLVLTGFCWDMVFPINKKIWTSSYAVYTTGLALLILGVMIWLIEFRNRTGTWSRFFDVFGKNALFIFVMSGILPRLMGLIRISHTVNPGGKPAYLTPFGWFYEHACKPVFPNDPRIGSLLYALCFIAMMWFLAWLLDRRKIYIRV
jgi:predicted acyltransferase